MTTQQDMVLDYMRRNGAISSLEAFNELYITRLSAVIWILRQKGYEIDSNEVFYTDRNGRRGRKFVKYVLKENK